MARNRSAVRIDHDAPVVRYTVGLDETVVEALLGAFAETDRDVHGSETPLYDWIDGDALNALFAGSATDPHVSVHLWGYPVEITAEQITIWESAEA